ncbi:SIR2 family protein [Enterovibrio sp. ZSDZ35]|uniref:SIR2 family protein n=1 Tax=Enterovibrio qingdaonensis TaxID=2899818 RepID=A0ABT5QK55_9GAMM|nr:SIR2 family protein [Enterovibrio sp. ZSDZ35]MDD1781370.1 SIR2 family protein [Enterovibrio sp. ZSDZ35]
MRFVEDGPLIPDELLIARDEGRVVFFCGAGVSLAKAGLADFVGLTKAILSDLRVPDSNEASIAMREMYELGKRSPECAGLITADRVFGLLEREFDTRDIESAVAKALKPADNVDLSAHQTIIDLATTPDNRVHLVTTNFDTLFTQAKPDLDIIVPPRLPDPARPASLDGVIHLHGAVDSHYEKASGDGFILSSGSFGRAYLAEAWATNFIKEVLQRYVVVFLGYQADDPPVHYLLEAMSRGFGERASVYAFQSDDVGAATAKWSERGVKPIVYSCQNRHSALWDTLELWAERARNVDEWQKKVFLSMMESPKDLKPYQRGQVAHLISSVSGSELLTSSEAQANPEWLCVLDPIIRYSKPTSAYWDMEGNIDPFELYCLDDDPLPADDRNSLQSRIPSDAWSAFNLNQVDMHLLGLEGRSIFRGYYASMPPELIPRMRHLALWVSRNLDKGPTLYWASSQTAFHPYLIRLIESSLSSSSDSVTPELCCLWQQLLDSKKFQEDNAYSRWYEFKAKVNQAGWSYEKAIEFGELFKPSLRVSPVRGLPLEYFGADTKDLATCVDRQIVYPIPDEEIRIPDEWLETTIRSMQVAIELACALDMEKSIYNHKYIEALLCEEQEEYCLNHYESEDALPWVKYYLSLIDDLSRKDADATKRIVNSWGTDSTLYRRLRFWAYVKIEGLGTDFIESYVNSCDVDDFYSNGRSFDLLQAVACTYSAWKEDSRSEFERQLLEGPSWYDSSSIQDTQRKSSVTLQAVYMLKKCGYVFSSTAESKIKALHVTIPEWEYREEPSSGSTKSGFVRTTKDYSVLNDVPLKDICRTAKENTGSTENWLVENAPFSGLVLEKPIRAFLALAVSLKHEEGNAWAWIKFLHDEKASHENGRLLVSVASRLMLLSKTPAFDYQVAYAATSWLQRNSKKLHEKNRDLFVEFLDCLITCLEENESLARSGIVSSNTRLDWFSKGINSTPYHLADALVSSIEPSEDGLSWQSFAERLLRLNGNAKRFALVRFTETLGFFYHNFPSWTKDNLLNILFSANVEQDTKDAFWDGLLRNTRVPPQALFVALKREIAVYALSYKQRDNFRGSGKIAGLIVGGWWGLSEGTPVYTDNELTEILNDADNSFLARVLSNVLSWHCNEDSKDKVFHLLSNVWPRQRSARSPEQSSILCEILLKNEEHFGALFPVVKQYLTTINRNNTIAYKLKQSKDIIAKHPNEALDMLSVILPANANDWSYGIEEVFEMFKASEVDVTSSQRYVELVRKLRAR